MNTEIKARVSPNDIKRKQIDELLPSLGVFWAFSNEQFAQNKTPLKDGEKYVRLQGGGFIPKGNVDALIAGMKKIDDDFKLAMKDEKERKAYIRYELDNHEAYYTRRIDETMDALGDDFTRDEVMAVFNMDYTLLTLGALMTHRDQNIKRQAMGIFKALPEANARIGKEYMEDAMKCVNDKDHCPACLMGGNVSLSSLTHNHT